MLFKEIEGRIKAPRIWLTGHQGSPRPETRQNVFVDINFIKCILGLR